MLLAVLAVFGPAVGLAMNVRASRRALARSADGATLYEVRENGPEGGGALTYVVQGKAPGDAVEFVLSSDFSPGDGSRPQRVSPELCRQRVAALGAALTKRRIPGVTLHPEACDSASRAGLVVSSAHLRIEERES